MIGQKLNHRYTITARVGEGGMGEVFQATDERTGQQVAVKILARHLTLQQEALERFRREAETLRQLKHPNIVGFIDAFEHEEQYVIVMEYVPGGSLHELIKKGQLPVEQARQIGLDLCDALIRAHRLNIIHRDLKPENVLVDQDGTPKLADFGVARLSESTRMTRSGTQVGTPYYMAPEAWEGKSLDAQADIWSLGVILFEMLTGQVPFGGDTGAAVMNKVLTAQPPDLKKLRVDIPTGFVKIIKRMLTRDKKQRYQTMREVAVDLERTQQLATTPVPAKTPTRASAKVKMPSWLPAILGIGLVLALSIFWFATQARQPANTESTPTFSSAGEVIATADALKTATLSPAGEAIATGNALQTSQAASDNNTDVVNDGPITIRWLVGLGTGTDPAQVAVQEEVVKDFNASQDKINLVLEVVPFDSSRDTLSTQIASGEGPDIVGPVGWGGSNDFYGQWLDLAPHIEEANFDTSIFDAALIKFNQVEGEQIGLPFAVFPGAMYYVPAMFDEANLAYPPQTYGEKYVLDGNEVDWNWDTVTEVARRLTIDVNGLNSTEDGFDRTQIVQIGYHAQWQSVLSVATFYDGAAKIYSGNKKGEFKSTIPAGWKDAWQWYYDSMWGDQPFNFTGLLSAAPEYGGGNVFNTGKVAMGLSQTWYTCCLADFAAAGSRFQLGIQPMGSDGKVHGRIDADTFRIWKDTPHPNEAFQVLAYLITTGGDKLLPAYGAMPAIPSKTKAFFQDKSRQYPFVTQASWDVFVQGLAYPDTPSAEQYQPNPVEATARFAEFFDLLNNTEGLDFDVEYQKLVNSLNIIYNR